MNPVVVLFLSGWLLGLAAMVYGLQRLLSRRRRVRWAFLEEDGPRDWLQVLSRHRRVRSFREHIEERAGFAGTGWSCTAFLGYSLAAGALGFYAGFKYLNNPAAALPLAFGFGLAPWTYLTYLIVRKEILLERQLIPAIQYFVSEYGTLPNIVTALNSIVPRVDYPLQTEVERLVREINSGRRTEDALFAFARRLNSKWAFRFAHILNLRFGKGLQINTMLFNLYMDMKTQLVKEKERSMESVGVRVESYLLYLFIPVIYGLASRINPQAHLLLTQTTEGRQIVFLLVVMLLGGIVATIRLGSVRIK